jgi:serine/threonine protein kinase
MKVYPWVPDAMTITREGVLDWTRSERLVFLRTLLLAVWELHELQIAHGDIKKENILIAQLPVGPVARLIDFDEAFLADTPPLSLEETEVGTTLMAPEWKVLENPVRAAGLTGMTLGTRTDLFQLAVVLEGVFGSGVITWNTSQLGNLNDHADYSLAGATPNCSDLGLSLPRVAQLMRDCLNRQSSRRPSIETLLSTLGVSSP